MHRSSIKHGAGALLWVALAAGCGPLPIPNPLQPDGGVDAGFTVEPTLSDLQAKVLTPSCALSSCHGGNAPSGQLSLKAGESHAELVNVESTFATTDAGIILVVPGQPEESFLMDKLTMTDMQLQSQGLGRHMPWGTQLHPVAIDAIRTWIANGAQDN